MLLNDTILMTMFTINMIATMPNETEIQSPDDEVIRRNITTTTMSPEKKEDTFNIGDDWKMWRCYYPFGCFYNGAPWSGGDRPDLPFPERPDVVAPHYMLYTRNHSEQPHELFIDKVNSIRKSPVRSTHNLYFIIHGFLDSGNEKWILRTKNELLIREDCNVVVVNWIGGAGPPYPQAAANTRLVGAMTAKLAAQLIKYGHVPVRRMHAIGHSLGAHISGYLGYQLRFQYGATLGRITGLDPANVDFDNTPSIVRLDPTDATFVTVIHTNSKAFISGGLGIGQPVGHIDFYPNGGQYQPGCDNDVAGSMRLGNGSLVRGFKKYHGCHHLKSYDYFIESINTQCPFIAVPCASWSLFQEGGCFDCVNQYCPRLGINAEPGNYQASVYLMTGSGEPFCKGHYRVTIKISNNNESLAYGAEVGTFVIRVIGTNGNRTEKISLSAKDKAYEPGTVHTTVLLGNIVGEPKAVKITWKHQTSFLNPLTWRLSKTSQTYIDSLTIDSLESGNGITVCTGETKVLIADIPRILTSNNCRHTETNVMRT